MARVIWCMGRLNSQPPLWPLPRMRQPYSLPPMRARRGQGLLMGTPPLSGKRRGSVRGGGAPIPQIAFRATGSTLGKRGSFLAWLGSHAVVAEAVIASVVPTFSAMLAMEASGAWAVSDFPDNHASTAFFQHLGQVA